MAGRGYELRPGIALLTLISVTPIRITASPIPIGVTAILIGVAYPHVPALASRSSVTTSPIRATSFVRSAPLTSTIT